MDYGTGLGLVRVKQLQTRVFERLLQDSGVEALNGPQGWILMALWVEDDISIVDISRRTGLAKNTLTAMLSRMEECGLIRRETDEKDRRQVRIHLTDMSESLRESCEEIALQLEEATFKGFSAEERKMFQDMLEYMAGSLEEEEKRLKKKIQRKRSAGK